MRFTITALAAALFFLASCSANESAAPAKAELTLINQSFDALDGWAAGNQPASLSREKAHSGQVSVKVGAGIEYGVGYANLLGHMRGSKFSKIKVSAWVFLPNEQAKPILVTEFKDPATGKQLGWEGLAFAEKVTRYGQWVRAEREITLPAEASHATQMLLYAWGAGSPVAAYIDDVEVTVLQ